MERRNMLGGGIAAGVTGLFGASAPAAAAQRDDDSATAAAIERLRQLLERQFEGCELGPCAAVTQVRQQQRTFLRASQKFPDFIEVGLGVWDDIYDWHVKHRQPITVQRLADGRYVQSFMFTTLILRHDQSPDYVGFGFDAERRA